MKKTCCHLIHYMSNMFDYTMFKCSPDILFKGNPTWLFSSSASTETHVVHASTTNCDYISNKNSQYKNRLYILCSLLQSNIRGYLFVSSVLYPRLLWHVDFRPGEQTERSSVKEGGGRPKHPDAGADGGSHWTLGSCPGMVFMISKRMFYFKTVRQKCFTDVVPVSDVRELQGERFGHLLHGPPADPVEERREAVPAPQPGTVPEAGGEWRTLTRCLEM